MLILGCHIRSSDSKRAGLSSRPHLLRPSISRMLRSGALELGFLAQPVAHCDRDRRVVALASNVDLVN